MTVYFIGAGPGAADLLTVRAARLLAECPVCLYAGSIVPPEALADRPEGARTINTARMPLAEIIALIADADAAGQDVARLHSGDPSLYSAVAEQTRRLDELGIPWRIVPGVPAFAAAAAALGRELTVPTVGQSVILTRVDGRATPMPAGESLPELGHTGATMIVHLAAAQIDRVVAELTPTHGADCPVAVVALASRSDEQVLRGTLGSIADAVREAGITRTAVIIVGRVLAAEGFGDSFLYSDSRPRDAHGRTICEAPLPTPVSTATPPGRGTGGPAHVLILGGTAEARLLATSLVDAGVRVTSSLAGRVREPAIPVGEVRVGGFGGPPGLAAWIRENGVDVVVDATHPFAERISVSAAEACGGTGVRLLALHRPAWVAGDGDNWIVVPDMAAAAEFVALRGHRAFLTIGRQQLAAFAGDGGTEYLIRCVDEPECALPPRHTVILDRGPFTEESELELLRGYDIDVLVTKNSGGAATEAKLAAARTAGIPVVMVARPPLPGGDAVEVHGDAEEVLAAILR